MCKYIYIATNKYLYFENHSERHSHSSINNVSGINIKNTSLKLLQELYSLNCNSLPLCFERVCVITVSYLCAVSI